MANNRIQIKRSATTATPSSLLPGELAFSNVTGGSGVLFIGDTSNTSVVAIGGVRNPGTLTANQALVANASSAIDKVIVANLVPTNIWANGATANSGDVLYSDGSKVYWKAPSTGVAGSDTQVQFNDGGTLAGDAGLTYNKTSDTLSTNSVFATSTVNAAIHSVGTQFIANSTQVSLASGMKLSANGSVGSANQVLRSDSSGVAYWSADAGDISAVTAGNGLTGGGTDGDVTLDVAAGNGISVSADAVAVLANNGIVANTSGLWVKGANGISVDSNGVNVLAGNNQVVSNASGVFIDQSKIDITALSGYSANKYVDHTTVTLTAGNGLTGGGDISASRTFDVGAGNGISVSVDAVAVSAGANSGLIVNASGLFVSAGDGLTTNASTLYVGAGNGISVSADQVFVKSGSTLTVNSDGVHVNSTLSITDLTLAGNLVINGTLTTVNTTNLTVKDPLIKLANGNDTTDSVDIGLYGVYGDSGAKYTGLFRDATDGFYKLFTGSGTEPTTTVDTGAAGYSLATLYSYLNSGAFVSNSLAVTITANSSVNVNITANSLTLSTALAGTSGGTGKKTIANNSLLYGNSSNGYEELTLDTTGGYLLQTNGTALVWDYLDGGTF